MCMHIQTSIHTCTNQTIHVHIDAKNTHNQYSHKCIYMQHTHVICTYMHNHIQAYTHIQTHTHAHINTCIYLYTYVYVHVSKLISPAHIDCTRIHVCTCEILACAFQRASKHHSIGLSRHVVRGVWRLSLHVHGM